MSYVYDLDSDEIRDSEDGQLIATMSDSATPEQGHLLASSYELDDLAGKWLRDEIDDGSYADALRMLVAKRTARVWRRG